MYQQKTAIATQIIKQRLDAERFIKLAFELSPALKPNASQPVQPLKPPAAGQAPPPPPAPPKVSPPAVAQPQSPPLGVTSFLYRNQYALPTEAQNTQQLLLQKMHAGQQLSAQEQQQFQTIQKQEFDLAAAHPGGYEAGRAAQTPRTAEESAQALARYNAPYEAADAIQRGIDQTLAEQKHQRQLASGDWWSTWGMPIGAENVGRAFGKHVWHPASETLGQVAGLGGMGLKMVGNQLGAGYMALDSGYNKLRANMSSDSNARDQFQNNATESWRTAQRLNQATEDTKGKLWRGETVAQPHVAVDHGPDGKPTLRLITDPLTEARQEMVAGAGQDWANSGWGQAADVTHGIGSAAADTVPYLAVPAGVARGVGILRAAPGGLGAMRAATTANNFFNPVLRLSPTANTALTAGGAGIGAGFGVRNVMNANTPEERVNAGGSIVNNAIGGGFLGHVAAGPATNIVRRAVGAGEAAPAVAAGSAAVAAPAAAVQATNNSLGATARAVGRVRGIAAGIPAYEAPRIAQQGQAQAGELAESVAQGDQLVQDAQLAGASGVRVDPAKIPPAFHADLTRTMGIGENGVEYGTSLVNDASTLAAASRAANEVYENAINTGKSETEAAQLRDDVMRQYSVETTENADFLQWMQDSGAYRGPNGEPGAIEQQATTAGQAAFDETFKRTGREAEAEKARNTAYRDTFTGAYKADQETKYNATLAEIETDANNGAGLDAIVPKIQQAWQHYARANPGEVAMTEEEFDTQLQTGIAQLQENKDAAVEAVTNPEAAAQLSEKSRANFEQQQVEALAAEKPMPTDPKDAGDWWSDISTQVSSAWENMGPWGQLAFGLGVPLGLIGILGGGIGGLMVAALGLGVAGTTGALAGMFGGDAQSGALSAVGNIAGGIGALTGQDATQPAPSTSSPPPGASVETSQGPQQSGNAAPASSEASAQNSTPQSAGTNAASFAKTIALTKPADLKELLRDKSQMTSLLSLSDADVQSIFSKLSPTEQRGILGHMTDAEKNLERLATISTDPNNRARQTALWLKGLTEEDVATAQQLLKKFQPVLMKKRGSAVIKIAQRAVQKFAAIS